MKQRLLRELGAMVVVLIMGLLAVLPGMLLVWWLTTGLGLKLGVLSSSAVVAVCIGAVAYLCRFGGRYAYRLHGPQGLHHHNGERRNMFDESILALEQIAKGNYNVFVKQDERFQYHDLADKINHLAKELSSMEQIRQDFVSNVSHEIQSPLTSIKGFAQLLKKEDIEADQRSHYLGIIEAECTRLSGLSDHLMKLALLDGQKAPFEPVRFRLDQQLQSVILSMEPQWAGKELELSLETAPVTIEGDRALLNQVWVNLLHNAIKFTPRGGGITVALKQADGMVRCSVTDNGPGIAPADQLRVFERFYKADKSRERSAGGSGLGLSLVQKIAQLHGGEVAVHSELGRGSTFTVALPVHSNPANEDDLHCV